MTDASTVTPDTAAATQDTPKAAKPKAAKSVFVRATGGDIRHLFTNVVFNQDPKKVEVDGFLQAQIDAGKIEIVPPDSL